MPSYSAIVIHQEVPGGRSSGFLNLSQFDLKFESDEFQCVILLADLRINAGGAGNRFVFFSDKSRPELSIYTADKSILKNPLLLSQPHLSAEIRKSKGVLNKAFIASIWAFLVVILLIAGLYYSKDKMVESLANQVPKSWEQKAGDQLFTALSLQYRFVKNDSLKKRFLEVARPLFKQVESEGYKIDLYFVNDPAINAFALPGGKVVVQTGLIENAESWEEVMGVMGHELAHVTRRHHVRGVINNIGMYTLLAAISGDVSALAGTFANVGGDLASLANSRTFETEADDTGWDYLVSAKINPAGLISFFDTIKKEQQTKLDSVINKSVDISFLSTHPNTGDRIKRLKRKQKDLNEKFAPLSDDFDDFKSKMSKLK